MRLPLLVVAGALLLTSCDATNTTPDIGQAGAPESISGLQVVFGLAARDTVRVTASGLGGGASAVLSDTLRLKPAKTYTGYIRLDGAADAEVRAKAESHLYTYAFSSSAATLTRTDRESRYTSANLNDGDYVLGRRFTVKTDPGASGRGTLAVRLTHFEGAAKTGEADESGSADAVLLIPVVFRP